MPDAADAPYIIALGLVSRSPAWLTAIHAQPMFLGLDLRGGVHFMLQVDMQAALTKKADAYAGDLRSLLREKNIRHGGINRDGQGVELKLRDEATLTAARNLITDQLPDLQNHHQPDGDGFAACQHQARGAAQGARAGAQSKTSSPCTTVSTSWAWPSR